MISTAMFGKISKTCDGEYMKPSKSCQKLLDQIDEMHVHGLFTLVVVVVVVVVFLLLFLLLSLLGFVFLMPFLLLLQSICTLRFPWFTLPQKCHEITASRLLREGADTCGHTRVGEHVVRVVPPVVVSVRHCPCQVR
jgi:hypothetical protein